MSSVEKPGRPVVRLHQLIDPWVAAQPQALAVVDGHVALDYRQLNDAVHAASKAFTGLGVRPGDRVLIVGENCAAIGVFMLALSRMDAWTIVVNARLSPREVDSFIHHSGARRVVYTCHVSADAQRHAQRHGATSLEWPELGEIYVGPIAEALPEPCHPAAEDQVAAVIYTSGTSGAPKGVMLTHANLIFAARASCAISAFAPGDLIYGALPMAHVVGLSTQFLGCVASGAALLLEARFTPVGLARAFAKTGVTAFTGVPAMFAKLLEWSRESATPLHAPKLRFICSTGAPLTPRLKEEVEATFGLPLNNGYGLTETSPAIARTRIDVRHAGCTVGFPLPGLEIRLLAGAQLNEGDVGELWVRGPNVMKGYYKNSGQTQEVLTKDGWFNTGDLARLDAQGALHIVGRTKELIIRSGFNVYPVEVEQVLNSHPAVVQSAVVGRTVSDNEEVVAFVETVPGFQPDEGVLRNYLRERLSPYKVPTEIRFLAQLPCAPTGKILKNALREQATQGAATTGGMTSLDPSGNRV